MKKKIVSVCLTAMLVGGLSMTSMQEARAAEGKVIDGSELTHDEESIGYDTKITRGEDLLTGYSKCTKLGDGKIYAGGTTVARQVVKSVQIAVLVERAKEEDKEWSYYDNWHKENKIPIEQCQTEHCMWKVDIIIVSAVRMLPIVT